MRGSVTEIDNKRLTSFENKHTVEDLKTMQAWSLERKIQVTQTRIIEWYMKNKGNVYVSFSGGKDSTVLLHIVRQIYPDVPAVFIDTGLEYPEVRKFAMSQPNVTVVKPEMNFRKVIETYGYPLISKEVSRDIGRTQKNGGINHLTGEYTWAYKSLNGMHANKMANKAKWAFLVDAPFKVSNQCCDVMKKNTAHKYEKQTGRKVFVATMACESNQRRMQWLQNGCNSFDFRNPSSKPMSFWTEQDVLEYINRFDLPYASVYGDIIQDKNREFCTTGCDRTGCVFCGFGCHLEKEPNRFQRLKVTHPQLWQYCMKPWDEGGLGMREVLEYIGVNVD